MKYRYRYITDQMPLDKNAGLLMEGTDDQYAKFIAEWFYRNKKTLEKYIYETRPQDEWEIVSHSTVHIGRMLVLSTLLRSPILNPIDGEDLQPGVNELIEEH